MKRWLRWLGVVALVPVALAGMVGAALAYPQPFFAYHAERGRLALNSDQPFDRAKAQVLLARIDARLKASDLDDGTAHAIFIANADWRLQQWVREGVADYVGLGGDVDVAALHVLYRKHDRRMNYAKSGHYMLFRLLAAYFIQREHWTVNQLLNTDLPEAEAVRRMDAGVGG